MEAESIALVTKLIAVLGPGVGLVVWTVLHLGSRMQKRTEAIDLVGRAIDRLADVVQTLAPPPKPERNRRMRTDPGELPPPSRRQQTGSVRSSQHGD